jgi:intracellular septation protein
MLNFLYDFVPVLLFFVAFKWYGIYVATVVGIAATAIQVLFTRIIKGYFDKKQVITFAVFVLFGSMTLYFHNPIFVKWKPTVIFWTFAILLLGNRFVAKKTILERLFDNVHAQTPMVVPEGVWSRLTYAWTIFFFTLGTANIYIAYTYSTESWVNFKFYGILGALLIFSIAQAVYLARYFPNQKQS